MRKLKVINSYTDKELAKNMVVGFEFETSEQRAKVLIDKDFCIEVTEDIEKYTHVLEVEATPRLQPKQRKPRTKK